MARLPLGRSIFVLALLVASQAHAQVTFNVVYGDAAGSGFNDNTIDAGETLSRGQLRRNTVASVTSYLQTVFDGRGTVTLNWDPSGVIGGGALAQFGPEGIANVNGTFQNGQAYQSLRTGTSAFGPPDGSGKFDFTSFNYNYVGANNNNGSKFDMFSIALHEITHGMGFINFTNQNGLGLNGTGAGNPDIYSVYDRYLQRGNGAGGQLFNTDITSGGFGSFTGLTSTFVNGNDPLTGLFFGGQYAREVFGGAVPLYAPGTYAPGSSIGHDNTTPNGVMNPSIGPGVTRPTYQNYEIAMLLDLGYNVYNWNGNTTAAWTGGNVNNLAASPWRTNLGIVFDGSALYNMNGNSNQAPILAPYGQVTSNIVLNFSGTAAYTATNDLGTMRMSRINLDLAASAATTSIITGGTLLFGQNSDGSFSVLTPKIVQKNTGSFNINSTVQIADPTRGLTVDGAGTGSVTFSGNLTGAGGLTKSGAFTVFMSGAANSYAGATIVNQGVLQVNGAKTGTGTVSVNSGGTLVVNGSLVGALTVNNGGVLKGTGSVSGATGVLNGALLAPGNSAGNLTFTGGLTMSAGAYDWELASLTTSGGGTNFDLVTLNGGTSALGGTSKLQLDFALLAAGLDPNGANAFWKSTHQWQIVSLLSGSLSGDFASIINPTWASGTFSTFVNASGVFLSFAPAPEPSSFVLLFAGGALFLWRRRGRAAKR